MIKKMKKNQKGFTLVEVIVVAVIVAVLAAVAIPLYMGYIKDSRINVCNNVAGSIASGAGASRQQDVANVAGIVAQSATKGPAGKITFIGQNNTNNTIAVPDGYEVTITDGTVIVFYVADNTVTSKTFNW